MYKNKLLEKMKINHSYILIKLDIICLRYPESSIVLIRRLEYFDQNILCEKMLSHF